MTFSPITLGTGITSYNYIARTRATQQALFDQTPLVSREVALAAEKLKDVETSDDLMADRTLLKVALGAFGLEQDLDNRAFIKNILDSDLSDRRSLANRLTDKRYLSLAEAFNFQGADGPRLPDQRSGDELAQEMQSLRSADDLLSDRSLLRASLERFGLESNIQNTYFLKQVLESDLSDPTSFANRFDDENLVAFAEAFDFFAKETGRAQSQSRIDGIVETFSGSLQNIETAEDLLDNPELLEETLEIFGLEDIYTKDFLRDVLNSDLFEPNSFANTQTDARFAAFAAAFNFTTPVRDAASNVVLDNDGQIVFETGKLELFLSAVDEFGTTFEDADDFLSTTPLRNATFDLLGLPQTVLSRSLVKRVLDSDPTDPKSFAREFDNPQYKALEGLFAFEQPETKRSYPEGFVDQVVRNYLDRQFEIQLGEVDPDMRVALSLERELNLVTQSSTSNDAQWFSVMSSPPLRQVFEGAFRLPSSFGSIDIDQQLGVLKQRSQQFFGTAEVKDFTVPDTMNRLRESYLVARSTQTFGSTSNANIASVILANF